MQGLSSKEVEVSRKQYGSNNLTQIPPDPLWKKILEGFKDPMIMILLVALVIQVILFFLGQAEWFEPVGILIAILIGLGIIGGIFGSILLGVIGLRGTGIIGNTIVGVIGACALIAISRAMKK